MENKKPASPENHSEEVGFMFCTVRLSGLLGRETGYAFHCISCGECVDKCSQNIEIPDILDKIVEEMEDAQMDNRIAMAKKMLIIEDE